jgi:hypothetical protein
MTSIAKKKRAKKGTVHFRTGSRRVACGALVAETASDSRMRRSVTCRNCRRSVAFKVGDARAKAAGLIR